MDARSNREKFLDALKDLPQDATVHDAIERLLFVAQVEAGLDELDAGAGIEHDEARQRLRIDD